MAGEAAAAAGMATVADTEDKRQGAQEINKTRDYIAQFFGAVRAIAQGGTGANTAAQARANLGITATNVPSTGSNVQADIDFVNGKATAAQNAANQAQTNVDFVYQGNMSAAIYSRLVGGVSVYITSGGLLGYLPSGRQFKDDVRPFVIDAAAARAVLVRSFTYRADLAELPAGRQVGVIADELLAAGLDWLVVHDDAGVPIGVHYDRLSLVALALAQHDAARLDELERRVDDLAHTERA